MSHVHIIGAGLAGLSAAVALTEAGRDVTLYEAGPAAGGRCRSYFDRALDCRIDNGNHLLLSGNRAAMDFLATIGASDSMTGPGAAFFPFIDLAGGERWTVRPGGGRIPWWIFNRRVPGTRLRDYVGLARLRLARAGSSVAAAVGGTALYRRLLEPLAVSALNTPAETGLASLMWAVVDGSLAQGGRACVPLVPREGLSESFVDPALAWLAARGGRLHVSTRVSGLEIEGGRVAALHLPAGREPVGAYDAVVMAVPPWVAADMLPGLPTPRRFEAIINVHFRVDLPAPVGVCADIGRAGFVGVIGGTAEWIFLRSGIVSVTISAANRLLDVPTETIAMQVWDNIQQALSVAAPMPPVRVVREKRATFAATAENEACRPGPDAGLTRFAVAGDWTATGLPATIEGAITSGRIAAKFLLAV